jgi:hypothetical protein
MVTVAPPTEPVEFEVTVPVRVTYRPGKGGTLHLAFIDCVANVSVDGVKVGEVVGVIGGGVEVTLTGGDAPTYYIAPADIFEAVAAAHEKVKP